MLKARKIIKKGKFVFPVLLIIAILSTGLLTVSTSRDFKLSRNMDIFFSMIREISIFYVEDVDPGQLIEKGISGVLEGLDPYTSYIPESEKENYATMTTGRYGGVGALIRQVGDHVMIIEPYEGFPAQEAGFRSGDIIIEIDGVNVENKLVNEVSEKLKGRPGSTITISVRRDPDQERISKELIREEIKINNVAWAGAVSEGIGYIQLNSFTENAHKEVRDEINRLKREKGISSLILDLRGNPGGLLMEAVHITNLFVDKGEEIVSTRGKVEQWDHTYRARNNPAARELPLVVLIGRSSASASEIVAGAVQDLDRGILIGQRTFGKGLIQTTRQLGFDAQLKITTARYYTPSGRSIQSMDFSRDGDNEVKNEPQLNQYHTRNGRRVFDGGGIMPDILIVEDRPSALLVNLYTRNHIFNFATHYASINPEIARPDKFELSDDDYRSFIEYLEEEGFDYQTQTEVQLQQLIRTAQQENYYEGSESLLSDLQDKLGNKKSRDLEIYRDEIQRLLREEIVSRYYYQKGRVEASLRGDPYVERAVDILQNPGLFNSILDGSLTAQPSLTPFQENFRFLMNSLPENMNS